jgi:hypothetical protein
MIELSHLPSRVDAFLGPDYWDNDLTLEYYVYIQVGQQRELASKRILQFTRVNCQDLPNILQTDISHDSGLRYDGASQLFVAHILHNQANNPIVLCKIIAQLPPVVSVYRTLLDPKEEQDVLEHGGTM